MDGLQRLGAANLSRSWAPVAVRVARALSVAEPDFGEDLGGPVPSLWVGEFGILLVAHRLAPATWQEERQLECCQGERGQPQLGS